MIILHEYIHILTFICNKLFIFHMMEINNFRLFLNRTYNFTVLNTVIKTEVVLSKFKGGGKVGNHPSSKIQFFLMK